MTTKSTVVLVAPATLHLPTLDLWVTEGDEYEIEKAAAESLIDAGWKPAKPNKPTTSKEG